MKNNKKYYKLCEDEILDIINDHLCQISNFENLQSKLIILGKPNKDLKVLAVITPNLDERLDEINLEEVDEGLFNNIENSSLDSSNSIDMSDKNDQLKIVELLEKSENE